MNQEKVTQETNEEVKVKREEFAEEAAVDLEEERRKHVHKLAEMVELDDRIREICPDIENILYKYVNNDLMVK